jgi:2-hydroxychromene-2-carboxylate isomerase
MTPPTSSHRRTGLVDRAASDRDVTLVAFDLASVESYLLVRALSYLAVEEDGALWCPLASGPARLDLDIDAARLHARRLGLPFVAPERHPAPVPRAMRIAAAAAARSRGAIFAVRATRLAWSTGADLDRLDAGAGLVGPDSDDDPEGYLRLMVQEIGLDVTSAKLAAQEGSECDRELSVVVADLAELGIHGAPALRWRRRLYSGLDEISTVLEE